MPDFPQAPPVWRTHLTCRRVNPMLKETVYCSYSRPSETNRHRLDLKTDIEGENVNAAECLSLTETRHTPYSITYGRKRYF
jgi:hypothetical protein